MKVKSQLKVTFYFSSVGDIPVRKLHVVGQTQFLGNIKIRQMNVDQKKAYAQNNDFENTNFVNVKRQITNSENFSSNISRQV